MNLSRRHFGLAISSLPLVSIACGRPPQTPLAHLHGKDWVHGAYELYAKSYLDLQTTADSQTTNAYAILAQKGVTALDGLQSREVPFQIRIDDKSEGFSVERNVPERLTFTADMNESDRKTAEANWNLARQYIHTDYEEVRRLNFTLTSLLTQLRRIRNAIDDGRIEQYRLAQKIGALADGTLPFPLPLGVTNKDYEEILYLLVERLDDDRIRLQMMESSIVAVGLGVRATDAGSGSLSANIRKVLLAVVKDSEASHPRPADFPVETNKHDAAVAKGKELTARIRQSPEYSAWLREERNRDLQQIGGFLSILDAVTGLPTSAVFRQVVDIWSGQADYLSYVQTALSLVPGGGQVASTLREASNKTKTVRTAIQRASSISSGNADIITAATKDAGLVNVGSQYARSRVGKQIVFYQNRSELDQVAEELAGTGLLTRRVIDR